MEKLLFDVSVHIQEEFGCCKNYVRNVGNVCGMSGTTSYVQQNYFFYANAVIRMIGILDIIRT